MKRDRGIDEVGRLKRNDLDLPAEDEGFIDRIHRLFFPFVRNVFGLRFLFLGRGIVFALGVLRSPLRRHSDGGAFGCFLFRLFGFIGIYAAARTRCASTPAAFLYFSRDTCSREKWDSLTRII